MRKQYKDKARSCALCKPHKRNRAHRWTAKDRQVILESDREIYRASSPRTT